MSIPFRTVSPDLGNMDDVCSAAAEMLYMGLTLSEVAVALGKPPDLLRDAMIERGYPHPSEVWRTGRRDEAKRLSWELPEVLAAKVAGVKRRTFRKWMKM